MSRTLRFQRSSNIALCPKCGNKTEFKFHSQQVSEDCCEVWAECKCGYDPTSYDQAGSLYRLEDTMGGCDDDNCFAAIGCWNDAIYHLQSKSVTP